MYRRHRIASLALALLASAEAAAQTPPCTDVFIATLSSVDGRPSVRSPSNATKRDGYDNQPVFTLDGRAILFTSERGGQTDIYRFDLTSSTTEPVTRTAESEYSPTVVPGGGAISVIRVERDSAQRLWRFPIDGGTPSLVLEGIRPVGYHAWADGNTLVLFVLGSPNTLQVADTRTGRADTITTSVGRSLHRMRDGRVSFVHKVAEREWWIKALDVRTRAVTPLVRLQEGVEDYVWLPSGGVLAGKGSALHWWAGGGEWQQVADFAAAGVGSITRLAVSPKGDRLAFVAVPTPEGAERE